MSVHECVFYVLSYIQLNLSIVNPGYNELLIQQT